MLRYIVKRIGISILTLFALTTISFLLVKALPGSPFTNKKVPDQTKTLLYKYYQLDKPVIEQYFIYLGNLLRGDLGYSIANVGRTVNGIIKNSFPYSADLGIRAIALGVSVGILLGVAAALRRGGIVDKLSMILAIIGISIPSFIIGAMIQYVFGVALKLLPVATYSSFKHTILPTVALSFGMVATIAKYMRASMLDVIYSDYVKTADAKGLSTMQIIFKHQIRNAILPIVTMLGPMVASVLTGSFVVERIFAVPGLGQHFVTSVTNLDYSLIVGLTVFFGAFLVVMNLLVDIIYGLVDPRIRVES
jgi:oligopeptide transport system permease protein